MVHSSLTAKIYAYLPNSSAGTICSRDDDRINNSTPSGVPTCIVFGDLYRFVTSGWLCGIAPFDEAMGADRRRSKSDLHVTPPSISCNPRNRVVSGVERRKLHAPCRHVGALALDEFPALFVVLQCCSRLAIRISGRVVELAHACQDGGGLLGCHFHDESLQRPRRLPGEQRNRSDLRKGST